MTVMAACYAGCAAAYAQTDAYWLNPVDGAWRTASNWSTDPEYPLGSDYHAHIDAVGSPYEVDFDAALGIEQLTIDSEDATFRMHGGSLTIYDQLNVLQGRMIVNGTGNRRGISGGTFNTGPGGVIEAVDTKFSSITNIGTIKAIDLILAGTSSNQGIIEVDVDGILYLEDDWANPGTIQLNGGMVDLGGDFASSDIGTINSVGGIVRFSGNVDNSAQTLSDTVIGRIQLLSGTITGGVIDAGVYGLTTAPSPTAPGRANATLAGVQVVGEITVRTGGDLSLVDVDLTNNQTITIGDYPLDPDNDGQTGLLFPGTQTLGGIREIIFNARPDTSSQSVWGASIRPVGGTLTLGPNVTVRNVSGGGIIGDSDLPFVNQGLISAEVAGEKIRFDGETFINEGTIQSIAGAELSGWQVVNHGTINAMGPLTLNIFENHGDIESWDWMVVDGIWSNYGTITAHDDLEIKTFPTNMGTIILDNAEIHLRARTTTAYLEDFIALGASNVRMLKGSRIDNTGDSLHFSYSEPDISLVTQGEIVGGVITADSDYVLTAINQSLLRDVVIASDVQIDGRGAILDGIVNQHTMTFGYGSYPRFRGSWKNEGVMILADGEWFEIESDNANVEWINTGRIEVSDALVRINHGSNHVGTFDLADCVMEFEQAVTLGGEGEIIFGGDQNANKVVLPYDDVLTIGAGLIVRTGTQGVQFGEIGTYDSGGLINEGTIRSQTIGKSITIDMASLENIGMLSATNGGTLDIRTPEWGNDGNIHLDAGTVIVTGSSFTNNAAGIIDGTGTLDVSGTTFTNDGYVAPGLSPGVLNIIGDMIMGPTSHVILEIGGTTPGTQYDRLLITGDVTLDGLLQIDFIDGFVPQPGDEFHMLAAASFDGAFDDVITTGLAANVQFSPQTGTFSFTIPEPSSLALLMPCVIACLSRRTRTRACA